MRIRGIIVGSLAYNLRFRDFGFIWNYPFLSTLMLTERVGNSTCGAACDFLSLGATISMLLLRKFFVGGRRRCHLKGFFVLLLTDNELPELLAHILRAEASMPHKPVAKLADTLKGVAV